MMSMNKIRVILKISVALLCALILGFGIGTAITADSLSDENDNIQKAEKDLAKAQKLIDENPQIVVVVPGEEQAKEVTLEQLYTKIREANEEMNCRFLFNTRVNANSNRQELDFKQQPLFAKDLIPSIEKVEGRCYPAKATKWTMRRDPNSGMWKNIKINFTLPKKPKDAK